MSRLQEIKDWAHSKIDPEFIDESYLDGLMDGARWADRTMLDKVCAWLEEQNRGTMFELEMILGGKFIEDFRKTMEE